MSFKNYRRAIVLDFDYDSVKKGVPEASKQMALLNAEFRKQSEEARQSGSTLDRLRVNYEAFSNRVKIQQDRVGALRKELDDLTSADKRNEAAIARKTIELKNAETQLMKYEAATNKANQELKAQENAFIRSGTAVNDFVQKAKDGGVDLERMATQIQRFGIVLAGVGIAGVKMSGDLDQAMAKTATIFDETQVSLDELRRGVIRTSNDFNLPTGDMAEGLYQIISANTDTADSLEMLNAAALMAKVGFTDTLTAADTLTTIINSYGLEVKDATRITDQLVAMQKVGKITIGEFGDGFGKVAGMAAQANIPLEEMFAAVATLTSNGTKASEAITAMRAVITALIKPTKEAQDTASELGLQFNLAALQSKGLAGFLDDVQRKTRGSDEAMAKLFGQVEGLNSVFILTGKGAEQFASNIDEIQHSTGFADEALGKMDTSMEQFMATLNRVKNSLLDVGKQLEPLLRMFAAILELIAKMPPEVITAIAIFGMLTATLATMAKVVMSVSSIAGGLGTAFTATNLVLMKKIALVLGLVAALSVLLAIIAALVGKSGEVERTVGSIGSSVSRQMEQATSTANRAARGSYRSGLSRVPHDGYTAELHKDEEVLTANDPRNRNNRRGFTGKHAGESSTGDQFIINVKMDDIDDLVAWAKQQRDLRRHTRMGTVEA